MFRHEGFIHKFQHRGDGHYVIYYDVDASEGQCGAPLQLKGTLQSVGVHAGYYNKGEDRDLTGIEAMNLREEIDRMDPEARAAYDAAKKA